jgi:hypothetical protein
MTGELIEGGASCLVEIEPDRLVAAGEKVEV